jgi:Cu-Zn family superoxide dismutase
MKKGTLISLAIGMMIIGALAGCRTAQPGPMAMAVLTPISGSSAMGSVHFQELADGAVEVRVQLTNVPPGIHGFHVHEVGDCGDNGNNAKGHFNPMNMPHAGPDATSRHAGDFGNVTANANGEVNTTFTTRSITLSPGSSSAVGRAVILHANPDDLTTQPTGNAGGRIACGIVQPHTMMR